MKNDYPTRAEVLKFIKNFQHHDTIDVFTHGMCYWFAFMLTNRFPHESVVVYEPIWNHFAVSIPCQEGDFVFDVTGDLIQQIESGEYHFENWELYQLQDELETARIYKYCILKDDEDNK